MSKRVPASLRALVRERAQGLCEYCLLHEDDAIFPHQIDHIQSRKHRGGSLVENLAWACFVCNSFKGSDVAAVDLETGRVVRLFHPRKDRWTRHFQLRNARIEPRTAKGRVTEYLLQFNRKDLVERRRRLLRAGRYLEKPPGEDV